MTALTLVGWPGDCGDGLGIVEMLGIAEMLGIVEMAWGLCKCS